MRYLSRLAAVLAVSQLVVTTALAQEPPTFYSVTARLAATGNSCTNAPTPCEGASAVDPIGVYDFDVYAPLTLGVFTFDVDSLRFAIEWPAEWTPIAYELCDADLVEGDPLTPGGGLTIGFPACRTVGDSRPFLRLTIDCTTPGRLELVRYPDLPFVFSPMAHDCLDGYWYEEPYPRYVEVGDYCAAVPQAPCTVCPDFPSGHFDPESLAAMVGEGETFADTISVGGSSVCPGTPLCGQESGSCLGNVVTSEPWLHLELLARMASPSDQLRLQYVYRITADTGELGPGVHTAEVTAVPNCAGGCVATCMPLELTVEGTVSAPDPASASVPALTLGATSPIAAGDGITYWVEVHEPERAIAALYDVDGRRVAPLLDGVVARGRHTFTWPEAGSLGPGVYVLRIEMGGSTASRKIVIAPRTAP